MTKRKGHRKHGPIHYILVWLGLLGTLMGQPSVGLGKELTPAPIDFPLYVPLIYNKDGTLPDTMHFEIAYVTAGGAWLSTFDGRYKALLTTDVKLEAEEDRPILQVAPTGERLAIQQADGWAIYTRDAAFVSGSIGQGYALTWDQSAAANAAESLLLSQKGHGIDRWMIEDRQSSPLIVTSDETNDHSPIWRADGSKLAFAHHEFGTSLYLTLIDPFTQSQLPYQGENRAAGKTNETFSVIESVDSWHDQPISFHWSDDEKALIFAAKQTIYVVDLATKAAVTITPPGFGDRASGRAVDVIHDQILYFAADGIYVVGLDGKDAHRVVDGIDLHFPQWTSNGQQIVYRGTDDRLFRVNADGSDNQAIPYTEGAKQFDLLP